MINSISLSDDEAKVRTDNFLVRLECSHGMMRIIVVTDENERTRVANVYNFGEGRVGLELNHDAEGRL